MREAELQVEPTTRRLRAITDALQFELLREPLRDALQHVVDERAQRAGHRLRVLVVAPRGETQPIVFALDLDRFVNRHRQASLGALHAQLLCIQRDFDALWGRRSDSYLLETWLTSKYGAQNFAADSRLARGAIGHHSLTGADDGDTETTLDRRQLVFVAINPQTQGG